jgi:UDP-N-acetylmuramoyl-tripeptide--D-alanyl-D-alanine ligase
LENCGDLDGVLRAKKEIFTYRNRDGAVFLNGDDEKLRTIGQEELGVKPIFFGFSEENDFYASRLESLGLHGYQAEIAEIRQGKERRFAVTVPVPGRHMVTNAVAAAAVGSYFGLSREEIAQGIADFRPVGERSKLTETKQYLLFSDCYNANPASVKASIQVMKEASGRKVCVLGDMFELGKDEKQLHREIGAYAAEAGMDALFLVGSLSKETLLGAEEALQKQQASGKRREIPMALAHFQDLEEAKEKLPALLKKGDTILVKASHGMQFQELAAYLAAKGEEA